MKLRPDADALERAPPLEGEVLGPGDSPFVFQASPFDRRATHIMRLRQGATLQDAVDQTGLGPNLRKHVGVYLGEHRIDRRYWARIKPRPGAPLYIRVEMRGKDVKDILRTILMIAVVVVATIFAPYLAPIFGGGFIGTTIAYIGLVTIGQMLVNALIPPPKPAKDQYGFDQQPGNPYASITGLRNQYTPYGPIPRLMGQRRFYPVLAARPYTETIGKTQYLRMILLVGYGPIRVDDIRIGQTPISAFAGASWEVREGWPDDAPQTIFSRKVLEQGLTIFMEPGVYNERYTEVNTEEVSIDFSFPSGLVSYDSNSGAKVDRTVRFSVEWSADNGGSWTGAQWLEVNADYGTGEYGYITARDRSSQQEVRSGRFKVSGNATGRYLIRTRRITSAGGQYDVDRAYWTVLRSVNLTENIINMTGLCTISLRLQATAQLNGVPDIINCLASAYHPVYDPSDQTWEYQLTRSPAWQYIDVLRRRGTTILLSDDRLDLPTVDRPNSSLMAWATACDTQAPNAAEKRWTSDVVLEGGSILTAAQLLASHGRAQMAIIDGRYGVTRDVQQTTPVQTITPRNSSGYRGSKAFGDLPHALRVTYLNRDYDDRQDEVIVYRDGYNEDGSGGMTAASKFDTLDLPCSRSPYLSWREGRYHLAVLETRPEEHSVSMDIEALRCTNGDLVTLSHDVILIGIGSGKIVEIETLDDETVAFSLDIDVVMNTGLSYGVRVRHADFSTAVYPIVLDTSGRTQRVELVTPVATATGPQPGDLATFGESGVETAPMIVKSIQYGGELTARVAMVDAQEGPYVADTGPIPAFQSYINRESAVDENDKPDRPVLNVRSDEEALLRMGDGTLVERVLCWLDPYTSRVRANTWEVEWRPSGTNGNWSSLGAVRMGVPIALSPAEAGDVLDFRARTISAYRVPSDWEHVFEHTVTGKQTAPGPPSGFAVEATVDGCLITLTAPTGALLDIAGYELKYGGTSWADAIALGTIPSTRAFTTIALNGGETFRVKTVDTTGLYSTEVTCLATGMTTASGGRIIDWRGLPTNAVMGVAVVRSVSAPLSSSSTSSISVAAHDMYFPGQTVAMPSDTITGLSTDTRYWVFYDNDIDDYIAVTDPTGYYNDNSGRYIALGYQQTQNGGGGFTPPPPPPPGGGGGDDAGGGGGKNPD